MMKASDDPQLAPLLNGKTEYTLQLFDHFVKQFEQIGDISLLPAKTMIGIANSHKRIAWITQFGKNFVHVVFPFKQPYDNNYCFQKIAMVPGDALQYNHHLRIYQKEDINTEVIRYMKLAFQS